MARLSLSEPSLLTPNENALLEGFSSIRRPSVLQKRAPPPPPFSRSSTLIPCKTCHPSGSVQPQQHQDQQQTQSCTRSTYIHFCQTVQPSMKPKPVRRHSHNPATSSEVIRGDPRPLVMQDRNALTLAEPLSVIGKPCLPSCSPRPILATAAANGQKRTQLHVFLPTEAEGEEVDSESVDEGFMDELDSKITSLKLQQGAPKTVTYH
ncbi:uncharacterized protein LOC115428979 [Sphaeramia orbicularis]|uniref:uncharacterized protein LOC115428979 n=1 Tax=Sphaeramia orbicularis TaxID=375764 RepID=UPI00118004E7|nr:uncharacterized protein LOC115428979 [Sphaeramia orbicularis]